MSNPTQNPAFGKTIKAGDLDKIFLSTPGESLVAATLMQMSTIKNATGAAFTQLFGPYQPGVDQQRWADYPREDWSIRQLPAISIYEGESEDKTSSNAWLNGTITIVAAFAPNQRRSDLSRVQNTFKGVLQNFFESQSCVDMLDEIYWHERSMKVPGLNEYGKTMTWSPNVEALVEDKMVPVTLVNVRYRIDLRAWYRALEFQNRTQLDPYRDSLADLTVIGTDFVGVINDDGTGVQITIPDEVKVTNP